MESLSELGEIRRRLRNKLRVLEGRGWEKEPGGGYSGGHGLHGAPGVVQKTMNTATLKRNKKKI